MKSILVGTIARSIYGLMLLLMIQASVCNASSFSDPSYKFYSSAQQVTAQKNILLASSPGKKANQPATREQLQKLKELRSKLQQLKTLQERKEKAERNSKRNSKRYSSDTGWSKDTVRTLNRSGKNTTKSKRAASRSSANENEDSRRSISTSRSLESNDQKKKDAVTRQKIKELKDQRDRLIVLRDAQAARERASSTNQRRSVDRNTNKRLTARTDSSKRTVSRSVTVRKSSDRSGKSAVGLTENDRRWLGYLGPNAQQQVRKLKPEQVDSLKSNGRWKSYQQAITDADRYDGQARASRVLLDNTKMIERGAKIISRVDDVAGFVGGPVVGSLKKKVKKDVVRRLVRKYDPLEVKSVSGVKSSPANSIDTPHPKTGSTGEPGSGKEFSNKVKDLIRSDAGNRCVYCGDKTVRSKTPTAKRSNIDHAIPKARGGNNTIQNGDNTCQNCNLRKGKLTSTEYVRKLKRKE